MLQSTARRQLGFAAGGLMGRALREVQGAALKALAGRSPVTLLALPDLGPLEARRNRYWRTTRP